MSDGKPKNSKKYIEYKEYKTFIEAYNELGHQEVLRRLNSYSRYRIRARRDTRKYKWKIKGLSMDIQA